MRTNSITITNPGTFAALVSKTWQEWQHEAFLAALSRLLTLISGYLDQDPLRSAELFASNRTGDSAISWCIKGPQAPGQYVPGVVLAGVLHFHSSDKTWGIHT